jgi:alkylation response protein AidB-like acyl-CoA dehydrogenase
VTAVETAQRLADDLLFPRALETDRAEVVPRDLLDALANAGLYGLAGPAAAGGADADFATVCDVVEALCSGCLTTAFVWAQHLGAVRAAAMSDNPPIRDWVAPLCNGEVRAGLALGGAVAGPPALVARETPHGWLFDGESPFVSGWNRIDVVHTAARTDDGRLVWALVDAGERETLAVERLRLVTLDATATVRASFRGHPVPSDRMTSVSPYREGPTPPEVLRIHASFALGVVRRCCLLLGGGPLDAALDELRATLDAADAETMPAARAAAGELALRAAARVMVEQGSRSLLLEAHAQRLAREALFVLVYALRPPVRTALLDLLAE